MESRCLGKRESGTEKLARIETTSSKLSTCSERTAHTETVTYLTTVPHSGLEAHLKQSTQSIYDRDLCPALGSSVELRIEWHSIPQALLRHSCPSSVYHPQRNRNGLLERATSGAVLRREALSLLLLSLQQALILS